MKIWISIALAALALTVFVAPDAQGKSGPNVDQRLSGSTHVANVDGETGNTTSLLNVLAKGQPGKAQVTARLEFEPVVGPDPEGRCPDEFPLGADLVSFEFVQIYNDGSLLTGSATPGQAVCSDGAAFFANIAGNIDGGTGRFEGVGGTWEGAAFSPAENQGVTGTFTADLN